MTHTSPSGACPFHGPTDSLTRRTDRLHPTETSSTPTSNTPLDTAEHRSTAGRDTSADESALQPLHSYDAARQVLRDETSIQAGFLADMATSTQGSVNPVLYMQGDEHKEMRRATARYFTPTAVEGYGPMIAALADSLIGELHRQGEMNLDDLSLRLAVQVASRVVGLTDSRLPGMEKRIEAFVSSSLDSEPGATQRVSPLRDVMMGGAVGLFFTLDVKPAIEARRRQRKDDLIRYLLDRDYSDQAILTECIT